MTGGEVEKLNQENVYFGKSPNGYGFTYFAKKNFNDGDTVMAGYGKIINHQTPHISVQIGPSKHYLPKKWTGRYWNHSCSPNTYIKTRADGFPNLVASKKIKKGEEITYSYWMSEFLWSKNADENKVKCKCRGRRCKGKILSFVELPNSSRQGLIKRKMCSSYLFKTS